MLTLPVALSTGDPLAGARPLLAAAGAGAAGLAPARPNARPRAGAGAAVLVGAAAAASGAIAAGGGGPFAPRKPSGTLLSPSDDSASAAIVKVHSAPCWVQLPGWVASQIP